MKRCLGIGKVFLRQSRGAGTASADGFGGLVTDPREGRVADTSRPRKSHRFSTAPGVRRS